jgi:hypothetical protein
MYQKNTPTAARRKEIGSSGTALEKAPFSTKQKTIL